MNMDFDKAVEWLVLAHVALVAGTLAVGFVVKTMMG